MINLTASRKKGRWIVRQRNHKIAAVISINSFVAMSNARRLYGVEVMRLNEVFPEVV